MAVTNSHRPVTVAVSRFEDLISRGLRALIADDPHLDLVAGDIPHERLGSVIGELEPDVAILNFGSMQRPIEVHELAAAHPETKLVVLASRPSPSESSQMLAFGASATLSKETQARDVLNAIHLASRGLRVLPRTASFESAPTGPDLLTPREADVLGLLQDGRSNAEIAHLLHVGVETVRTHARNIYRKLGVSSRRELASLAKSR